MIRKNITEMKFVRPTGSMNTVEIDIDSLPSGSYGYGQLVERALAPVAAAMEDKFATVYVYEGPSINFHTSTWSAFFGVAGPRAILDALHSTFSAVAGVKVRHSDSILSSQALCQYHIQEGRLWQAEDAAEWSSADAEDEDSEVLDDDELVGRDLNELVEEEEDVDDPIEAPVSESIVRAAVPNRYRAARADASIGSIRQTIEAVFGLPAGSVALRGPDRSVMRADATIRTLRKRWDNA